MMDAATETKRRAPEVCDGCGKPLTHTGCRRDLQIEAELRLCACEGQRCGRSGKWIEFKGPSPW